MKRDGGGEILIPRTMSPPLTSSCNVVLIFFFNDATFRTIIDDFEYLSFLPELNWVIYLTNPTRFGMNNVKIAVRR